MNAIVLYPPVDNYGDVNSLRIFLGGSIDMGKADDWQSRVIAALSGFPVTIFNPRRLDWDSTWVQDISDDNFRGQVNWELDHLHSSDYILFHFDPVGQAPITLMELGLMIGEQCEQSHTIIVSCPPGFWRRGNVQIMCDRYAIPLYDNLDDALTHLKSMLKM